MNIGKIQRQPSPFLVALKRSTRAAFELHGVKQYLVADHMGVNKATVTKWLDIEDPDWPGWDRWQEMAEFVRTTWGTIDHIRPVASWFDADMIGAPGNPQFDLNRKTLGRIAGVLASKSGKVLTYLIQILEDGQIDPEEEDGIRNLAPEIQALLVAVMDLDQRCKAQRGDRVYPTGRPA